MMKKYIRLFFGRISKDFKQKQLLPVKFLFFIQMSTILVLYPYLTIHMRELGINVEETAIMSAVTPVVGIFMPPVAGMLADKIGNFRFLLASFSALGGLAALLLLLVPIGRVKISYPDDLVTGISCNFGYPMNILVPEDFYCIPQQSLQHVNLSIKSCGYVCHGNVSLDEVISTQTYKVKHVDQEGEESIDSYYVTPEDSHIPITKEIPENHELYKINRRFETALRRFADNVYYFPSNDRLFNLSCLSERTNMSTPDIDFQNLSYDCSLKIGVNNTMASGLLLNRNISDLHQIYNVEFLESSAGRYYPKCSNISPNKSINVQIFGNNTEQEFSNCQPQCLALAPRKQLCTNRNRLIEINVEFTFWTYLAVRVFIGIVGGTSYTMFEGAVIAILREYKADYGLQRMYASIGGMISSPLAGWLIDYSSRGKDFTDYRSVFFLYAVLKVLSALLMMFINLEFKTPSNNVISDVLAVLNIELLSLFVASFLLGSAWGYIESFLFWLLQDLGGSKSLMGLTITVGGLVGIPILVLSGPLIKRLGHANVIFIGFVTYAIRLLGYSLIYNPWFALIFEAMECFTHSLCFTAAVTYAARLSTVTTDTTIQGIFGGLFYGVGKSFGSLVGGYLIKAVGIRLTFKLFALMTGVVGFIYLAFYHLYMKQRSRLNRDEKTNVEVNNSIQEVADANVDAEHEIVDKAKSIPFEDTLTNMAYEDTEGDLNESDDKDDGTKQEI